jgi:hypothetical protein
MNDQNILKIKKKNKHGGKGHYGIFIMGFFFVIIMSA